MPGGPDSLTRDWPWLVAIEGPSGCGKSTMLASVVTLLRREGLQVEAVSNNDSGRWSPVIRALAEQNERPLTLAYATAAARAELREAHAAETLLVSDRYVLSSYVYQGYAGVAVDVLQALNAPLLPRTTHVLLDLPAAVLAARRTARARTSSDWFKRALTLEAEIELYAHAAETLCAQGHQVERLDASPAPHVVAADLVSRILQARTAP